MDAPRPPPSLSATLLLLALCLGGCEAALGPAVAVNGVSLMLAGRTVPDILYSAVSERDCSIARLDAGESYCRPEPVVAAGIWCTRSLGQADCWSTPPPGTRPVADPMPITPPTAVPVGQE